MEYSLLSWDEFGAYLDAKVASGEMTAEEAENEWLNFTHRGEVWEEW